MLTHAYADAAVPPADADMLRALVQAERGLGRSGASSSVGYDRLIALRADGQIYRIVVSESPAQTRAVYQVLAWFGCERVGSVLRPGIDDLFDVPPTSPLRMGERASSSMSPHRH